MTAAPTLAVDAPETLYRGCDRAQTIEDWWIYPEDGNRYEFVDGVFVVMAPPALRHQRALGKLHYALEGFARAHGGFAGVSSIGVALPTGQGFQPDVLYIRPDNEHVLSERGIEGVPDLVVEVASPSTRRYDRRTKVPAYLGAGVEEVWIVDLDARTTEVRRADGVTVSVFGERIRSQVVDVGDGGLGAL
ncbi:MAG: Uma2 family endonuclease [Dehalococcoidia bacterium]